MGQGKNKKTKTFVMIGLVVAAVAATVGIIGLNGDYYKTHSIPSSPSLGANSSSSSATIDGIQCGAMEQFGFHIHAHLDIFLNSKTYAIPALIGITDKCFYWLHTHDKSGVIHIEAPVKRNFTLGQFFDIWNTKFKNTQLFGNSTGIIGDSDALNVYVNGSKVSNGTNYRDIVLHAHDAISIVYGKAPNAVPSKYEFMPGQ
jgi:hypothetical protein